MEIPDLNTVLGLINTLGTVGVLLWMVFLFLKGEIINKSMLDRILSVYEERLAELTGRILDRLEEVLNGKPASDAARNLSERADRDG